MQSQNDTAYQKCLNPDCAAEFEPVVIGEWDGEILIMPDIDEKLTSQNIKRFREKLRTMAISRGIQIRSR